MDTKKLRQKILDLAIHGKLVPQDPNDEPASVLLERIKAEKERLIKEGKIKRSKKSAKTSDTPPYENIPFEVPEGWCITTLGSIFTLQAGKNIKASELHQQSEDYPYPCYGGNGIRGYVHAYNRNGHFPIIGRQGALCGNINEASGQFYATEHAVVVETYCGTDVNWAVFALETLNLNQYATATAQPGLAVTTINDVLIPVPPLKEQKRIVAEIGRWSALIDKLEEDTSILSNMVGYAKRKILDLAIHGKLVPQDPNDEPAIELLRRINPKFVSSDNRPNQNLPKGWEVCKLKDVATLIGNKQNQISSKDICNNGKYPVVSQSKTLIDGYSDEESKVMFDVPLILFGDHTRNVKYIDFPFIIGADGTKLIKTNVVLEKYLFYWTDLTASKIRNRGYARHFNLLRSVPIPIPPYNEQKRIVAKIEELFAVLNETEKSLEA